MSSKVRAAKAQQATRRTVPPERKRPSGPTEVPKGFKRWRGEQGRCLRCFGTIFKGDLVVALAQRGGWMHDHCG